MTLRGPGYLFRQLAAALLLLTGITATAPHAAAYEAVVTGASVEVRSGAGRAYYPVGVLKRGARVQVETELFGWYQVRCPEGVFSFVEQKNVDAKGDGSRGEVNTDRTPVYAAHADASKSPAESYRKLLDLERGDLVEIVGTADNFYKITPPQTAFVFLPPQSVARAQAVAEGSPGPAAPDPAAADAPAPAPTEAPADGPANAPPPRSQPRLAPVIIPDPPAPTPAPAPDPAPAPTPAEPAPNPVLDSAARPATPDALEPAAATPSAPPASPATPPTPATPVGPATPVTPAAAQPPAPAPGAIAPTRATPRPAAPRRVATLYPPPGEPVVRPAVLAAAPPAPAPDPALDPAPAPADEHDPAAPPARDLRADLLTDPDAEVAKPDVPVSSPAAHPGLVAVEAAMLPYFTLPVDEQPLAHMTRGYAEAAEIASLTDDDRRLVESRLKELERNRTMALALREEPAATPTATPAPEPAPDLALTPIEPPIEPPAAGQAAGQAAAPVAGRAAAPTPATPAAKPTPPAAPPAPVGVPTGTLVDPAPPAPAPAPVGPGYDAVGVLTVSTVHTGQNQPELLRLLDPSGQRTIAYLEPNDSLNTAQMLGQLVGITGPSSFDPSLKLRLIKPQRIVVLGAVR